MKRSARAEGAAFTRGSGVFPQKRELARRFRRDATASEGAAWALLRGRKCLGLKFRRQQVIQGYVVDFYCAELRLVLEIDGDVHDHPTQAARDAFRSKHLTDAGVHHVLRIQADRVTQAHLRDLLKPLLPLSLQGEGD